MALTPGTISRVSHTLLHLFLHCAQERSDNIIVFYLFMLQAVLLPEISISTSNEVGVVKVTVVDEERLVWVRSCLRGRCDYFCCKKRFF